MDNASVRVGDAEHLELESQSFDAVLCGFGVFFFPNPARALGECLRVLRPGGRFAASTFVNGRGGYPWADEVARELGKDLQAPESPVRIAEGLRTVLAAAGFENPQSTKAEARFAFGDVDAYVDWNWSHGGRRLLEQLSEAELARFREAAARRLAAHAVDGGFELVQGVELTVARRP